MKTPLIHGVIATCLFLAPAGLANAQSEHDAATEAPAAPKQIRVQIEFIDVSHEQLTELMFGAKTPANDGELHQQVVQLVKDGKASVMETQLCNARSGEKATTESVEEFIYPTEYEPAEIPNEVHVNGQKKDAMTVKGTLPDLATGPTPTAFDTRNLGSTLEIEPKLDDDGKTIHLRMNPEIVHHVGNEVWTEWKGRHGNAPIQMPKFYTLRLNSTVTVANGRYLLAGALSPKNQEGFPDFSRKLMVFVKADVIAPAP